MATHKPFRELVRPDSNFEFIGRIKTWVLISTLLISASIGMLFVNNSMRGDYLNWTIDFKGGTELIMGFTKGEEPTIVDTGIVRKGLNKAGKGGFDVSDMSWTDEETDQSYHGILIRTPEFSASTKEERDAIAVDFYEVFKDKEVLKASWSGDRLYVRAKGTIAWNDAKAFFEKHNRELKPWSIEDTEEANTAAGGTDEHSMQFAVRGIDAQYQKILQAAVGADIQVHVIQVDGVGAKAGKQLRNDGIKALFYAMALIMLYLAFRFDVRFAPGAVVALLHDALLVVGVFAVTWQPVSLSTVAALLTVIGYSVNDSVVIFDRIRENVGRLKDKKFSRIINISLNETMSRTLLTSITLFVVTLMMNIFGTGLVSNFAFAMNIGVIVGVYSSVFIASPVALAIHNKWFAGPAGGSSKPATKSSGSTSARKSAKSTAAKSKKEIVGEHDDSSDSASDEGSAAPAKKAKGPVKKSKKGQKRRR